MPDHTYLTQLPKFLTSFVGRFSELQELTFQLSPASPNRHITVTGAGGCGKTRLTAEAVMAVGREYHDSVYFVELGGLVAGSDIEQAVFIALGLQEYQDVVREESIALFLEQQPTLLVLDNCEHVIDSVRRLVSLLLQRSATIHVLCTSRELLGNCGEVAIALQPLALPTTDELEQFDPEESLAHIENSAVRLFHDRARLVRPDFRITRENIHIVVRLCRLLDGLPLAIELAAARVRSFSPAEIAAYLESEGISLLALRYSASLRHQTLDNAIAWSAELLPEQERLLFQRLAVFRGGWTLAAAEAVCCDEALPAHLLLTMLGNLLDKSLLISEQDNTSTRCHMLHTIHSYAERKLRQSPEYAEITRRHKEWIGDHSARAAKGLVSKSSVEWMEVLDEESENYTTALHSALSDDIDYISHVIVNISQYLVRRQRISEITRWTSAILDRADTVNLPAARGRAHYTLGRMNVWLMRYFDSSRHYTEAIRLALEAKDDALLVKSRVSSLHSLSNANRMDEALDVLRTLEIEGYAPYEPWAIANYALARGLVAVARNDYIAALNLLDQGVRGLRILGEKYLLAIALYQAGATAQMAGEMATAQAYLEESNQRARALAFHNLALRTQMRLAELKSAAGDLQGALADFEVVYATLKTAGESPTAHVVRSLANIAADANCMEVALLLYGAANSRQDDENRITTTGAIFHGPRVARARAALSASEAQTLWETGAQMNLDEVLQKAGKQLRDPTMQAHWGRKHSLEVNVLGPLRVLLNGEPVSKRAWKTAKTREMLALLAIRGSMSRERIEEALWSEKERGLTHDGKADKVDNLFGATLSFLRAALGSGESVVLEDGRYSINPALKMRLDLSDYHRLTTAAFEMKTYENRHAITLLEDAFALVRGTFLENVAGGAWVDSERAAFEGAFCEGLRHLGDECLAREEYTRAEAAFGRMLEIECMNEAAYRGLMQCYAARDDQIRMIRAYQQLEELLGRELGARPSPATMALYHQLFSKFDTDADTTNT